MIRPLPARPDLVHERASLIAQLALRSTFAGADIDTIHELLQQYGPARVLAALDRACDELAEEGRFPDFPAGPDADAYFLLYEGLRRLARLTESVPSTLLAAA